MRAWSVAHLRAAERAVRDDVPPGTLIQRAAAGTAAVCIRELRACGNGKVTGRRVLLLVGPGDNGADALWAGVRLRGRGAHVRAMLVMGRAEQRALTAFTLAGG